MTVNLVLINNILCCNVKYLLHTSLINSWKIVVNEERTINKRKRQILSKILHTKEVLVIGIKKIGAKQVCRY